ncbi:MAG: hypothetical protein J5879_08740 [Clostridia bacterium]|nr:hypothetical protein [Clostridia bacterium]
MKDKLRQIVSDRLFIRSCALLASLLALAVIGVTLFGRQEYRYVLQGVYVLYAVLLFFFVKTLIQIYIKYFRQKKKKKERHRLGKRLMRLLKLADDTLRSFFNMRPRGAYFGGEDTRYDADMTVGEKSGRSRADARIKWSSLRENREKVRFLYAQRVDEGISDGIAVLPSDTARQTEKKLGKDDRDKLLFELYESVRYTDHNVPVDDGTVNYLSERGTVERKKKK